LVTIKEITGTIERLLLPRLSSIEGEVKEVRGEIKEVRGEIKEVRGEIEGVRGHIKALQSDVGRLDDKIEERTRSIQTEIKGLSQRIDLVKDVEYLKVKIAALEQKTAP